MLVDDSQKDVSPLKESLLDAGYDVVETATTAAALLERVAALQPDVIIIDTDSPTRDVLLPMVSFTPQPSTSPRIWPSRMGRRSPAEVKTEQCDSGTRRAAIL